MTTNIFDELDAGDDTLARLHQRLEHDADEADMLDVAYRTIDTPVGTLLLAATTAGLVRVAYDVEGHDAVLAGLADMISPRLLRAPARLDSVARRSTSISPSAAPSLRCRSTCDSPRGSAATSSSICAVSATATGKAMPRSQRPSATPKRCAPSAPPAPTTRYRS